MTQKCHYMFHTGKKRWQFCAKACSTDSIYCSQHIDVHNQNICSVEHHATTALSRKDDSVLQGGKTASTQSQERN